MHQHSGRWQLGLALSLATALLWGLLPIALKIVLSGMDAWTITWWRFAASALVLGLFLAQRGRLPVLRGLPVRERWLLLVALAGLLANYVLYLVALDITTPSVSQTVIQIAPLLLLLGGVFVFREPFAPQQWLGFAVLWLGLALFFNRRLPELLDLRGGLGLGVLLMVCAAVSWAIYGLAQKALLVRFNSQQVLWLLYVGSAIVLLPFSAPATAAGLGTLQAWMLVFCCANTLLAYGAFGEALHHWEVSRVSAVLSTAPLVTISAMWVMDRFAGRWLPVEGLNALSVLGALAVVVGSMTCALAARRRQAAAPADAP